MIQPTALTQTNSPSTADRTFWLAALLLIAITIVVYAPVRHHEFINFDDGGYVYENEHVQKGLSADSIRWAFSLVKSDEISYWHPWRGSPTCWTVNFSG